VILLLLLLYCTLMLLQTYVLFAHFVNSFQVWSP